MMKKSILVGADPFPPYQYYDDCGNIQGSDYERVQQAFHHAGYEIKVILDEWLKIEEALSNQKIDAAFQVQCTSERAKKYYFSNILRNAVTEVVTGHKNLDLKSYREISDQQLTVGVITNYAYGEDIDNIDVSLKRSFNSQQELLKAINDQVVDIGIFDKGVKEYIVQQEGFHNIFSIKSLEFNRPLYVVFSSELLRDEFNEGMGSMGVVSNGRIS